MQNDMIECPVRMDLSQEMLWRVIVDGECSCHDFVWIFWHSDLDPYDCFAGCRNGPYKKGQNATCKTDASFRETMLGSERNLFGSLDSGGRLYSVSLCELDKIEEGVNAACPCGKSRLSGCSREPRTPKK